MPIKYKIDVLQALKDHGYNTTRLRREKLIGENTIQAFRERRPVSWAAIATLCRLLECQPGDLLEYVPDTEKK